MLRGVQQAARSTILNSVSQQHLIVAVAPLRRYVVRAVQERVCERVAGCLGCLPGSKCSCAGLCLCTAAGWQFCARRDIHKLQH